MDRRLPTRAEGEAMLEQLHQRIADARSGETPEVDPQPAALPTRAEAAASLDGLRKRIAEARGYDPNAS